jgi:hypothetical protein
MDLKEALNNASNAIEHAEAAADPDTREVYLRLAQVCLTHADVDEWFRLHHPTVIVAVDEKV